MELMAQVLELLEKKEPFCLATVVASSKPAVLPGAKRIIRQDGAITPASGTAWSSDLASLALDALRKKKKSMASIGGEVDVFFDVVSGEDKLLVCGAGHIAVPLARYARDTGFKVTILDDRPDFAHPSRFPECEVIAEEFVPTLREMSLGTSTYVVVITRGHEHDAECLLEILPRETAYVGLIGSRRRVRFVLEMLGHEGISPGRREEIFTPIGLPIGAESPEEIALSIMAELVCVRRKGHEQAQVLRSATGEGK